jgi:glycosyltransferase involved in cell wall biosynthesis
MPNEKACAFLRHPTLKEGQTAFAREFVKVLKMIYRDKLIIVDTVRCSLPRKYLCKNKYLLYLYELALTSCATCEVIHLLNVNKSLTSLAGLFGLKKVVSYQFSYLPAMHSSWKVKKALIEYGSKIVIGTSRRIANFFGNGIFIYPPVNIELFKPREKEYVRRLLGLPPNKIIIGYIGDIDINRGFDVVAKLAAELGSDDIKFLITYPRIDNITRDVMVNIKKALKKNSLIVKRTVPVWYVFNAIDVLLLPIRNSYPTEPPATLLEALASGTPVIGGPSPSMKDYEALYIKVKDDDYFLDVVKQTIDMRKELTELSIRAREFATKNLSYQAVLQRLSKIVNMSRLFN